MSAIYILISQVAELNGYRQNYGMTMHWRQYVLDSFVSSDLSTTFLNKIRADLNVVRSAKFTIVLRFMYTDAMPAVIMHVLSMFEKTSLAPKAIC